MEHDGTNTRNIDPQIGEHDTTCTGIRNLTSQTKLPSGVSMDMWVSAYNLCAPPSSVSEDLGDARRIYPSDPVRQIANPGSPEENPLTIRKGRLRTSPEMYDDGADHASASNIRHRQAEPALALCGEFTRCSHCILDLLADGHRLFGDGCEELVNDVSRDSGEHSLTHSCHCPPHLGFSRIYHLRVPIL